MAKQQETQKTLEKTKLNKTQWIVRPIEIATARQLVEQLHYAKSATKTRVYTHGLFHIGSDICMGVAWWLPPTKIAAVKTFPEGDWRKVLSLTRLVIHPDVPTNGASFLLAGSIKLIDKTKWHCLVTFADTWQNHTGTIYKATNWEYLGLTKPSPVYVNESGIMMGKKRGKKNFTTLEMGEMGFLCKGNFAKHKYRMIIQKKFGFSPSNP